jgi:hypothetical protein
MGTVLHKGAYFSTLYSKFRKKSRRIGNVFLLRELFENSSRTPYKTLGNSTANACRVVGDSFFFAKSPICLDILSSFVYNDIQIGIGEFRPLPENFTDPAANLAAKGALYEEKVTHHPSLPLGP